ncbi:MAG: hypothetical protein J7L54_02530, partial [Elusimicrobia bacterium]|nr:hypothetical protein [Elusimicrobiota bacterium]
LHIFRFVSPTAKKVAVAGSFNGWSADRDFLEEKTPGVFELEKELPAGTQQYKFVVEGKWIPDPSNPRKSPDGFGGFNSVINSPVVAVAQPVGIFQSVDGGKWKIEFAAPEGEKGGTALLYYKGRKWDSHLEEGKFSFLLPLGKNLERAWIWFEDENGNFSKEVCVYKNFSKDKSWPERVIYSVITDRFCDGDNSNDKPVTATGLSEKANYMGGDFAGIKEKLDKGYFDKMGIDVLWISPVVDNTNKAYKDALPPHRLFTGYHGYWPISSVATEEHFGSEKELKELVSDCHSRGIKFMADMVFNHVHTEHPWWREHPGWFGKLLLSDGTKNIRKFDEKPFTTWFDEFLPSFDYSNAEAVKSATDNAMWWIKNFGFDAFRLDAVKHIPHNFWEELRAKVRKYEQTSGKNFYLLGETIASRNDINEFVGQRELDGQFDFPLFWHIRDCFAEGKEGFDVLDRELKKSLSEYKNPRFVSRFIGNQDFPRFMAYADGDIRGDEKEIGWTNPPRVDNPESYQKIKMAFTFLLTNPGVPMIFYGDEIGMTGAGDPDNRRMMKFSGLGRENRKVFDWVSGLIKIRRAHPAITFGWHRDILVSGDVLVYMKRYFQDRVIVLFNKGSVPRKIEIPVSGRFGAGAEKYKSFLTGKIYKPKKGKVKYKIKPLTSDVLILQGG